MVNFKNFSNLDAKTKATMTYNAAADYFDHPVSSFWHCFGKQTINRINLKSGDYVLDVCCGSGGSALPAAEIVSSTGKVIAVDLAENLVKLAQNKAASSQLENIEFRVDDMMALNYPDDSFDAVVCVFGIFFVPDMAKAVKELWRMVKPNGVLAITTWGLNLFEPANSIFWEAIHEECPQLSKHFNPWERISTPDGLRNMLADADISNVEIFSESNLHPLHSPEDWWKIAMGSGYRGTLEQLEPRVFNRVYEKNLLQLTEKQVKAIETNVLYVVAKK